MNGSDMFEHQTELICFLSFLHDDIWFSIASLFKCNSVKQTGWLRLEEADWAKPSGFVSTTPDFEFLIGFICIT